jgi:hypothetical protein
MGSSIVAWRQRVDRARPGRAAGGRAPRHSRHLLVWMHVVTSVGWMSQALALSALLAYGAGVHDLAQAQSAYAMAWVLDRQVLLNMANASAFTGLMLSALTSWGYFRYWWVLIKFVITLTQLAVGIAVLNPSLAAAVDAARHGQHAPVGLLVASALMVSAISFQAWLSVAKPWKRTPWAGAPGAPKPETGPGWLFALCAAVPVFDYLLGRFVGFPLPPLSMVLVVGIPVWRSRRPRRGRGTGAAQPA